MLLFSSSPIKIRDRVIETTLAGRILYDPKPESQHGESLPRGRGFDERAARAAAEVRKKAAAKGLPVRSHGVPVQAISPLAQLLNIINAGATPDAPSDVQSGGPKKEDINESSPSENPANSPTNDEKKSAVNKDDQAPVGLGIGLTSLDSKKQKQKTQVSA